MPKRDQRKYYNVDVGVKWKALPFENMGQKYWNITCPFCNTATTAMVSSFRATGRLCKQCRAKHLPTGYTIPLIKDYE